MEALQKTHNVWDPSTFPSSLFGLESEAICKTRLHRAAKPPPSVELGPVTSSASLSCANVHPPAGLDGTRPKEQPCKSLLTVDL